jgi:hypothetical protein
MFRRAGARLRRISAYNVLFSNGKPASTESLKWVGAIEFSSPEEARLVKAVETRCLNSVVRPRRCARQELFRLHLRLQRGLFQVWEDAARLAPVFMRY